MGEVYSTLGEGGDALDIRRGEVGGELSSGGCQEGSCDQQYRPWTEALAG